eukprot:6468338-Amphidinium_carterae.1
MHKLTRKLTGMDCSPQLTPITTEQRYSCHCKQSALLIFLGGAGKNYPNSLSTIGDKTTRFRLNQQMKQE